MSRFISGPRAAVLGFLGGILLVCFRSGAFGVESKKNGGASYLEEKWSVVGSISPQSKTLRHSLAPRIKTGEPGGVVILMDRATSKTFALKMGDLIPGTDLFRVNQIGDQFIGVTDGQAQFQITNQQTSSAHWSSGDEDKFSPLGALEAYYQSLSERGDDSGESYQEFISRIDGDEELKMKQSPDILHQDDGPRSFPNMPSRTFNPLETFDGDKDLDGVINSKELAEIGDGAAQTSVSGGSPRGPVPEPSIPLYQSMSEDEGPQQGFLDSQELPVEILDVSQDSPTRIENRSSQPP